MKRFMVLDEYGGGYTELLSIEEVKEILVDEIIEDTKNNYDDRDIVINNAKMLGDLVKNKNIDEIYLKAQLSYFGWYVRDILDLQVALNDYQTFKHGSGNPTIVKDCIEETLKMIDEDMRK